MKAIVFGGSGQDGFYLRQLLDREQVESTTVARSAGDLIGDVADWKFVEGLIQNIQPDFVFHFAANSTTRHEALFENHQAIGTGAFNILEAVDRHCRRAKVFLSGSAMQFENRGKPIDERTPFAALSPYGVSRIQSVYAGRYYRSRSLKVYVGYFFNHDSPLRTESHINQRIARAARRIAAGSNEQVEIGDLTVRKEFNFAGDIVAAVWRLMSQQSVFEAVIGCGKAHSIEEWLDLCFGHVNKDWRRFVNVSENYQAEYRVLVSNPGLIRSLGWEPRVDIHGLAKMMMEA